jgi:hypothetical protein
MRIHIHITNLLLIAIGTGLIALGVLAFRTSVITLGPIKSEVVQPKTDGDTSAVNLGFQYKSEDSLWPGIFIGLGTWLISWVFIEWIKAVNDRLHVGPKEEHFLALLGNSALSRVERGRIIIQADAVENMLGRLKGCSDAAKTEVLDALDNYENNRLYKARTWVNARDAKATKVIRDGFRADYLPTPELRIIEHGEGVDPFEDHGSAPYVISMGFFTDTTTKLTDDEKVTGGSFYIDHSTPHGDAIAVRGDHLQADYDRNIEKEIIPPDKVKPAYRSQKLSVFRIYPKPWSHTNWKEDPKDVNDHGVIIRHTHREGEHKQVRLIVAGFTEDGTVAAARCLVSRQNDLYEVYKKYKGDRTNPEGDFVVVISGPTKSD